MTTTTTFPAVFLAEDSESFEVVVADAGVAADLAERWARTNGCVDDLEGGEILELEIGGFGVFVPVTPNESEVDW